MTETLLRASLGGGTADIALARDRVRQCLTRLPAAAVEDANGCTVIDDITLITSELVANAIVHGKGRVRLELTLDGNRARVQVVSRSRGLPILHRPNLDAHRGRGLAIVDRLATDWGWYRRGRVLVVWSESVLPDSTTND